MNLIVPPKTLSLLRVGKHGPAFIDVRPCRGGARLTARNDHAVSVVVAGTDVVPVRLAWADFVRAVKVGAPDGFTLAGKVITAGAFAIPVTPFAIEPEVPRPRRVRLRLPDAVIAHALARVGIAMSDDDTRPHLHSIHVQRNGGVLSFTATNGHRMHRMTLPSAGLDFECMVPAPAVASLARMKGDLTLRMEEYPTIPDVRKRLILRRGRSWVECDARGNVGMHTTATKSGARHDADPSCVFPDIDVVIPTHPDHTVTLDGAAFRRAVTAMAKHAVDRYGAVRLERTPEGMRLSARVSDDVPDARMATTLPCEGDRFGTLSIAARYLLAALGKEGPVTLAISGALDPVAIRHDGALAVVMPLRE